jgi:hypothetical protein
MIARTVTDIRSPKGKVFITSYRVPMASYRFIRKVMWQVVDLRVL